MKQYFNKPLIIQGCGSIRKNALLLADHSNTSRCFISLDMNTKNRSRIFKAILNIELIKRMKFPIKNLPSLIQFLQRLASNTALNQGY